MASRGRKTGGGTSGHQAVLFSSKAVVKAGLMSRHLFCLGFMSLRYVAMVDRDIFLPLKA